MTENHSHITAEMHSIASYDFSQLFSSKYQKKKKKAARSFSIKLSNAKLDILTGSTK
jgi:hypothetical protein